MPKIFTKAGADVLGMLDKQMLDFHPQLHAMDVKVGVIMVQPAVDKNCQPTGPAVSCHGVCVAAKIKLLSASDRVYLRYDAMMFIDELRWNNMDEKECNALLDHELTHLRLILDKNGQPKTNDDNRPKLAMRPDDWTLTGFAEVVLRHHESALEYQALERLADEHGNHLFPFMKGEKTALVVTKGARPLRKAGAAK